MRRLIRQAISSWGLVVGSLVVGFLLQRQIEATDAAIDALVYDLYGLTEDEIKIVEGGSGN